jgi:hypothetical protein
MLQLIVLIKLGVVCGARLVLCVYVMPGHKSSAGYNQESLLDLRYSQMLRSVDWCLVSGFSGLPIGSIFEGLIMHWQLATVPTLRLEPALVLRFVSWGVRGPEHEVYRLFYLVPRVKKKWSCTSTPLYVFRCGTC